eukprot:362989-Chlamydomonas_euryale.AAC.4
MRLAEKVPTPHVGRAAVAADRQAPGRRQRREHVLFREAIHRPQGGGGQGGVQADPLSGRMLLAWGRTRHG